MPTTRISHRPPPRRGKRRASASSPLPAPLEQIDRVFVRQDGRRLSYFAGCDYYRFSTHPEIVSAARAIPDGQGITVGASRKTTGNHPAYEELERNLARFFASPAALLVADGYLANLAVAQGLAGEFTHALLDERAHAALADAALFLPCPVRTFPHRDAQAVAKMARRCGTSARVLLLTDGLFAHSGEVAPLQEYRRVLPANAWLLVDDAHGAGVLGRRGRGTAEHCGVSATRLIQTLSLSKAFGVFGGVVLGPASLRARIIRQSRLFAGHTPLPLPLVRAAGAALQLMSDGAARRRQLWFKAEYVKAALREAGLGVGDGPGPIVALHPASARGREKICRRLRAAGIHPPYIHYLGGSESGYFRFVISSEHTPAQLDALVETLRETARWFRGG